MTKAVRRAFWILLVAGMAVALGLVVRPGPGNPQAAQRAGAVEDARFPAYLAALVGADLARGNRYEVLTNGDQIFPAMLKAIDEAGRRISFETYIYDTGTVATQFTAALERAARRGVRVQLTIDAVGASSMEKDHVDRLRAAGCIDRASSTRRAGTRSRKSTTGPIARSWSSTARSPSPAAPVWRTTGWATRRTRSTGATPRSG